MKIAIAKPDWRITGGFELVVERLVSGLEARGHTIQRWDVDVPSASRAPFGVPVRPEIWDEAPEYFRYLSLLDTFAHLDIPDADVVLSTQPPSFATQHRRHLSLFFHHLRIYYDLSEVFVAAGFTDPDRHREAEEHVRRVDAVHLRSVDRFLVSSEEVAGRLRHHHGFGDDLVARCRVGITRSWRPPDRGVEPRHVLCVSRHEFPKRTELFVEAMTRTAELPGVMVGTGGRLPRVRWLHRRMLAMGLDEAALDPALSWCNDGHLREAVEAGDGDEQLGNLRFLQEVPDAELYDLYTSSLCVVAPAYREDYGLTALEAMALGVPVIVCDDGGGLTELVEDGVSGLVVPPTGPAIAEAVRRLADDGTLRRMLGENGRHVAAAFTWRRTIEEFCLGLEAVCS